MSSTGNLKRKVALIAVLAIGLVGLSAAVFKDTGYSPFDKEFYLTAEQIAFVRPGLHLNVLDYSIADDGTVKVRFQATDDRGLPLDIDGVYTPGPINISFLISYIPADKDHYVAYATRAVTSPITGQTAVQSTADSGGTIVKVGDDWIYEYTFGGKLPAGFDRTATHAIGGYGERNLSEWELGAPMDDFVEVFVPAGGEPQKIREMTTNEACSNCHGFLRVHGRRHSYELCIMCHYDGIIDPDTGNSVDMPVMTHKIHRGANLPSVQAGEPYQIIGFRQSVHDYSEVHFPQDIRYCDSCHVPEAAQADAWLLNPSRAACGACHDHVNFATGENHAAGPTPSDQFCANCHFPEGELEFDASIKGAHTIPFNSTQLEGLNAEILDVTNVGPGQAPTVLFSLTDNAGDPVDPSTLNSFSFLVAGPTTDVTGYTRTVAINGSVPTGTAGEYTFQLPALSDDAEGSYMVGVEGYRMVVLNAGFTNEMQVREAIENTVFPIAVTDSEAVARRWIVSDEKCEACHRDLALHGSQRHNADVYCQICHNPLADDSPYRPVDQLPARSIDFKMLIHRIHTGEHLTRDYTQIGFRGSVVNYNHVLYPNNLADCEACHLDGTYNVPSAGVVATIDEREFFSPIAPNSAACLGCHDSVDAAAHAYTNITPFGESCGACHAAGREFAVAKVHAE